MALTYEQVRQVISSPSEKRRDFDINSLLPWFQKRSDVFKNLKSKLLFDVIKNLRLIQVTQDEIVIRQGSKGDCMYIILGGQVTIYNNDAKRTEDEDGKGVTNQSTQNLRQQLGNFVITLKSGSAFGEVALMGDDCIRSASVIADLPTDLMVIDRDLYNRSIKEVLKEEFDQKYNFILGNPYFNQLNAKYKKQLAMALEKETLPYEKVLANQGGKIDAIHFILSGEAAVMMDVDQHSTQYPNLLDAKDIYSSLRLNEKPQTARTSLRTSETSCSKKGSRKVHKIGICLLGINEAIGDIEVLLGLNTYMQTCICTQPTEVLVMGMKHYDRLLIRRNPKVLVDMRKGLELRIASRIANQRTSHIPLLASIKNRAEEFNFDSNEPGIKNQRNSTERLPAKVKKGTQTKDPADTIHPQNQQRRTRSEQNLGSGEVPTTQYGDIHNNSHVTESRDSSEFLAHVALEELERKMSEWMATGDFYVDSAIHSNRTVITPRITKMHRGQTEPEQMKPGAKVLIRPNKSLVEPIDFGFEAEHGDPKVYKAPARTEKGGGNREFALENQEKDLAELAYYKMALTAPCPIFDNDYEEEEDLTSYDRS